jgi:hypothetical protein
MVKRAITNNSSTERLWVKRYLCCRDRCCFFRGDKKNLTSGVMRGGQLYTLNNESSKR